MNKCCFYVEIDAPNGLAGIENHIQNCRMKLEPWTSGYNSKIILKKMSDGEEFEWSMDSSDKNVLVATGEFVKPVDKSKELIESLSHILSVSGFSHKWILDDEEGNLKYSGKFKWEAD